jgi:hypothetical protein
MVRKRKIVGNEQAPLAPAIWSALPEEISELVSQRVPFLVLVKFRLVCKQWNSVIMSSQFAQSCQRPISLKDRIDAGGQRPHGQPLPDHINFEYRKLHMVFPFPSVPWTWRASIFDGLSRLAHVLWNKGSPNMVVCNPLTRRWRYLQLPKDVGARLVSNLRNRQDRKVGDCRQIVTGLIVDQQTGSYKLTIPSLEKDRKTFIYDSRSCSWSRGATVPEGKCWKKVKVRLRDCSCLPGWKKHKLKSTMMCGEIGCWNPHY